MSAAEGGEITVRWRDTAKIGGVVAVLLGGGFTGLQWVRPTVTEYVTQAQATEIARAATVAALADQKNAITAEVDRVVRSAMAESIVAHDRTGHDELTPPQYREVLGAVRESETRIGDRLRELREELRGRHSTGVRPNVARRDERAAEAMP